MNRLLYLFVPVALLLAAIPDCAADEVFPVVHPGPIAVRVADGYSGKPLPKQHVVLVAGYDRRDLDLGLWREEAITDAEGKVRLSNALRNLPFLRVVVLERHFCAPGVGHAAFSIESIRADGLSSANRCASITHADAPGVFTVFVKDIPDEWPGDGQPAQPVAVASIPVPSPAAAAASAPTPVSAAAPSPSPASGTPALVAAMPERSKQQPDVEHKAETEDEPMDKAILPPIPFAIPASAELMLDSAPVTVTAPPAPPVVKDRQEAKPTPFPKPSSKVTSAPPAQAGPGGEKAQLPSRHSVHAAVSGRRSSVFESKRKEAPQAEGETSLPAVSKGAPARSPEPVSRSGAAKPPAGHALGSESGRSTTPRKETSAAPSAAPASKPLPAASLRSADIPDESALEPLCAPDAGQS